MNEYELLKGESTNSECHASLAMEDEEKKVEMKDKAR